ncbi:C-Myc-binding protein isoform X2 [Suricata suricatta]|uniref:C-Myc-binding protein isoform X2 n=1 Tax=Suricata suricatta TaxID=37032 RepID=UPI001155A1E6|nr:C-Myc-binding protein isoform X2 [Suricata suricatta]
MGHSERPGRHENRPHPHDLSPWFASAQAADSKREQFRRYLEKSGVLDTLTKVLVALYEEPEKPNSALDFLKHHLGATTPENPEIELLRLELAEMKEKYEAIVEENKKLKTKLAQYEPPQEEKRAE